MSGTTSAATKIMWTESSGMPWVTLWQRRRDGSPIGFVIEAEQPVGEHADEGRRSVLVLQPGRVERTLQDTDAVENEAPGEHSTLN